MLNAIVARISKYTTRKKWRRRNKYNETFMGGIFDIGCVSVGIGTYGLLNVICHDSHTKLYIGNYCSIAPEVIFVLSGEHRIDCLSTFPFSTHTVHKSKHEAVSKGNIIIDDDVWIGTGAKIMSGVHIHQGAVIAAGAVVTKDVPAYAIVAGVPAEVIRKRFTQDIIESLLSIDFSKLDKKLVCHHLDELYTPIIDINQLAWLPRKE